MKIRRRYIVLALLAVTGMTLSAQRFRFRGDITVEGNPKYDGRFTFTRLRYEGYGGMTNEGPGWMHDYPRGERNLVKILSEISSLRPVMDSSNVLDFSNPDLFKNPIAYLSEPGYWQPSETDIKALRDYLLKGGFLIIDDFRDFHMFNLEEQMRRVLPDAQWIDVAPGSQVWDSFFHIAEDGLSIPSTYGEKPTFKGIFEGNDPNKRLMVIANVDNDIGDAWQWSDQGYLPIDLTNEAYKLGVNYVMYGFTH